MGSVTGGAHTGKTKGLCHRIAAKGLYSLDPRVVVECGLGKEASPAPSKGPLKAIGNGPRQITDGDIGAFKSQLGNERWDFLRPKVIMATLPGLRALLHLRTETSFGPRDADLS